MFLKITFVPFVLFLLLSTICFADVKSVDNEELRAALIELLENQPMQVLKQEFKLEPYRMDVATINQEIAVFYRNRDFHLLWVGPDGPGKRAEILLFAIDTSDTDGLNPDDYKPALLRKLWKGTSALDFAKLDVLLTLALGKYVSDAREGRLNPRKVNPKLFASARDEKVDPSKLIKEALAAPDLKVFLEQQMPQHQYYQNLRGALVQYRKFAAEGGWRVIPEGKTLKLGMEDPRVLLVCERLAVTGDLKSGESYSMVYDEQLVEAVTRFQMRHSLDDDGIIGKATLAAMNVSAEARVRQIVVNMERWRWVFRNSVYKQVVVNIARFKVFTVQREVVELFMPVIVGKEYHATPVFSSQIKYVEINPFWNIPTSIAVNEMLPKLKKNPNYLKKQNIRVFNSWNENAKELNSSTIDWNKIGKGIARYKLRQDPGPKNALGLLKIMFPNKYSVYLHDTPSHSLFERTRRTFSHGCIRVSRPVELASYVLGGEENGWTEERIKEIIHSKKRTVVNLKTPMPVTMIYRTVWLDTDGILHFAEDVYGRDKLLEKALYE